MKICVDKNHLLVIENEAIPRVKEYTYNVGGYLFSDFDKGILVLNKKVRKVINLKNLGDNMSVAYVKNILHDFPVLNWDAFGISLEIFHSFDEDTGDMYFFVPALGEKELSGKNEILKKLKTGYTLQKTAKGMLMKKESKADKKSVLINEAHACLSYLFGLFLLYGKFDAKKGELVAMKIQIPLFGGYLELQEDWDDMIKTLQGEGMFLKADKLQTSNGIIYQISCTDYEVLEVFAKWYEPVEKFERITKRDFTADMKNSLLAFVRSDSQIPDEGKNAVIELLEKGVLKLLAK